MPICIHCGTEVTADPHTCADPLDGFDTDCDVFEPVQDEAVVADGLTRRRFERAADGVGWDLMDPSALDQ